MTRLLFIIGLVLDFLGQGAMAEDMPIPENYSSNGTLSDSRSCEGHHLPATDTAAIERFNSSADTEVPPESLLVFGKGIQNKDSKDMVLLACVGGEEAPCECLKHVYYKAETQKSFYFGRLIRLRETGETANTKKALLRTFRHLTANFKAELKRVETSSDQFLKAAGWFVTGSGAAVGLADLGGGKALTGIDMLKSFGIYSAVLVGAYSLFIDQTILANSHSKFSVALRDKNGWNRSSHPTPMSAHRFEVYRSGVLNDRILPY